MTLGAALFVIFLVVQRLVELAIARTNTARLLSAGAREVGAAHYPLIIALHVAWIGAIAIFGRGEDVRLGWLTVFTVLQLGRVWVLATLGPRWTTRIIVTGSWLVTGGPFRWLRHPNYTVVALEVAVAPLVLGLSGVALVFSILNGAVLWVRIGAEDRALSAHRPGRDTASPV